jgi:hypothetical protein
MYYPYFSVIMQYDEKLRRLRRNIYPSNSRSYMVRRNTRALSFFSPFLTFADAHTDPRSIASRHSKRNAMVSTARTVQLIIRLVRGWISANKVHKVICPTSPLYNTPPRTSTLHIPYVKLKILMSSQHSVAYEISILRGICYIPKSRFSRTPQIINITLFFCAVAVSDKVSRNDSEDDRTIAIDPLEQ